MKIAIFTDAFFPQMSGVVTATASLAKGLADRGHKVFIVIPKFDSPCNFSYPNVKVKTISSIPAPFYPGFRFSFFSAAIIRFLKENEVDIVHIQSQWTMGMQGIISAKMLGIPLVGTFHTFISDPQYLRHIGIESEWMQKTGWEYSNFFYRQCDLVTAPAESTKRELLKNNLDKKIKVISNGIDFRMFDNRNAWKIKRKYGKGKYFLFVGRIAHEKNLPFMIRCFRKALCKAKDIKLLIVGNGPQFNEVMHLVNSYNLSKNVFMLGEIPHPKLIKSGIFGACDVFMTASTTENQPVTVLEAQANGLACIGLDARGIPDLVKNNYNGFVVPANNEEKFADAIVKIASNDQLLRRMRKNTLRAIKTHELQNVISEWEKEYGALVKYAKSHKRESARDFSKRLIKFLTDRNIYSRMKKKALNRMTKYSVQNVFEDWEKEYDVLMKKVRTHKKSFIDQN